MKRAAMLVAVAMWMSPTHAATLSAAAHGEIDALLSNLGESGCLFYRNGSWHGPQEAQAHLLRKLDYLEARGAVGSAEQFIERAATRSSMTGQAYRVKCGSAPVVQSGPWLSARLQAQRAASPAATPSR